MGSGPDVDEDAITKAKWRKRHPPITKRDLLRRDRRWSLEQFLVWIATRDLRAVAAANDVQTGPGMGFAVAAVELEIAGATTEDRSAWAQAAITALKSGRLDSFGRVNGEALRKLEPFEWDQFEICFNHAVYPRIVWNGSYGGKIENVGIDAVGVLKEFPAILQSGGQKSGPKPNKREGTKLRMIEDIRSGKFTVDKLRSMLQDAMAKEYGVSRYTALKALSELETPTNTDTK